MNLLEFITDYIKREWSEKYQDKVLSDIVDVMIGNREGNTFENQYCQNILNLYNGGFKND